MTSMIRADVLIIGETIQALTVVAPFSVFMLLEEVATGIADRQPPH
ncbi:hypothetical protein FHW79_006112 [Azospirillum sp. OGB3]|nr:hypothetical protein [Azospirillum sp. OGB3]MBB3268437.1 hypothetical protein [Azospirillum sp. OGB3]